MVSSTKAKNTYIWITSFLLIGLFLGCGDRKEDRYPTKELKLFSNSEIKIEYPFKPVISMVNDTLVTKVYPQVNKKLEYPWRFYLKEIQFRYGRVYVEMAPIELAQYFRIINKKTGQIIFRSYSDEQRIKDSLFVRTFEFDSTLNLRFEPLILEE